MSTLTHPTDLIPIPEIAALIGRSERRAHQLLEEHVLEPWAAPGPHGRPTTHASRADVESYVAERDRPRRLVAGHLADLTDEDRAAAVAWARTQAEAAPPMPIGAAEVAAHAFRRALVGGAR